MYIALKVDTASEDNDRPHVAVIDLDDKLFATIMRMAEFLKTLAEEGTLRAARLDLKTNAAFYDKEFADELGLESGFRVIDNHDWDDNSEYRIRGGEVYLYVGGFSKDGWCIWLENWWEDETWAEHLAETDGIDDHDIIALFPGLNHRGTDGMIPGHQ